MLFRCVHLIGVLGGAGISPERDIIGTASLRDLEDLRSGRQQSEVQAVIRLG
jgi:hypothetical protein